jgi:hypothetical protein
MIDADSLFRTVVRNVWDYERDKVKKDKAIE